jgi:hypothetical protein
MLFHGIMPLGPPVLQVLSKLRRKCYQLKMKWKHKLLKISQYGLMSLAAIELGYGHRPDYGMFYAIAACFFSLERLHYPD